MIIITKLKLLMKLIGLDPLGGHENVIARFVCLIVLIAFDLSMCMFFILNIHVDKYRAWAMIPPLFTTTSLIANYSFLLIDRERCYSLLDELKDIVNERARREENELIYMRAERRISFATNIFIYSSISISIFSLSPFLLAAYHWCLGEYSIDSWVLFYPVWTPFELNTASRCALMILFQTITTTIGVLLFTMVPSLLIAIIIYSEACFKDIKQLYLQADRLSRCKIPEPSKKKNLTEDERKNAARVLEAQRFELEMKMLEHFKEAAELHRKWIRLTKKVAKLMNCVVLMTVMPYALCACSSLLAIEKYSGANFLYDMQVPILAVVFPLISLALLYYMGQRFHSNLMDLNVAVYQSEWYQYPRSARRFVLLMMMRSQQPSYLSAYGLMYLNWETFVSLLNWMYSAFMLLRSLD